MCLGPHLHSSPYIGVVVMAGVSHNGPVGFSVESMQSQRRRVESALELVWNFGANGGHI